MRVFDANTHIEREPISIRLRELDSWDGNASEGSITHYATVQDILAGMRKHSIDKALVMPSSVTTDKDDAKKATEMVAQEIRGYENLYGAACVHPYSKTAVEELEEGLIDRGLSALMLSPDRQGFELNDEALWMMLERVEELKAPVVLHTQWSRGMEASFSIHDLLDIGSSFHIDFILTHLGAGLSLSSLAELADLRNMHFEVSHSKPRDMLHALQLFGSERLIFGSDFSYNLYPKYELEKVLALDVNKRDKERILSKNIERMLGKG